MQTANDCFRGLQDFDERRELSPPPKDDPRAYVSSQTKPRPSQLQASQSREGFIQPSQPVSLGSITLDDSDDDDDEDDCPLAPPPKRPRPAIARSSSPTPPALRSGTLEQVFEDDAMELGHPVFPTDDEEDQLADDEDECGGDGYQPPEDPGTPNRTPSAGVAQTSSLSSSPSVESASQSDRQLETSPMEPSSPEAPLRSPSALPSGSPAAATPIRISSEQPAVGTTSQASKVGFPFKGTTLPRQPPQVDPYSGLVLQTTSTNRHILVPKGIGLNHDRKLDPPPPLPTTAVQPASILRYRYPTLAPIAAYSGPPVEPNQAKRDRIAVNKRRRRLDPIPRAQASLTTTASTTRMASRSVAKLAHSARKAAKGGDTSDGELASDPELSDDDKLDFRLLEINDSEGNPTGSSITPAALLMSYDRWAPARKERPHRAGTDFPEWNKTEFAMGHSTAAIAKMDQVAKANVAFLSAHAATPMVASSRPPEAENLVAGPSTERRQFTTLLAPLKPASSALPAGWPSLSNRESLAKQAVVEKERKLLDDQMALMRKVHGTVHCHRALVAMRGWKKERATRWEREGVKVVEVEVEARGGGEGVARMAKPEVERDRHNPRPLRRAGGINYAEPLFIG